MRFLFFFKCDVMCRTLIVIYLLPNQLLRIDYKTDGPISVMRQIFGVYNICT